MPAWLSRSRLWIIGTVVVLLIGASVVVVARSQAPPEQPIPFPHNTHIALGVQCLYCHPGASRGRVAGLPTVGKCQGCHSNLTKQSDLLDEVSDFWANNETVAWAPVAIQPDFVYFTHRPHIAAGLNCENCHGDLSQMTVAEPFGNHNMGWCLNCHQDQGAEKWVKLSDCATCHQ